MDFDKYFSKKYQFYLKKIDYKMLNEPEFDKECKLVCEDHINTEIVQMGQLHIDFVRNIKFDPDSLYSLSVAFGAVFEFKNDIKDEVDIAKINWDTEVVKNRQKFLSNIVSRASLLISQITSSYGLTPVVTPPTIIQNDNMETM